MTASQKGVRFPFVVSDPDLYNPNRGDLYDPERGGWYGKETPPAPKGPKSGPAQTR